MVVCIELCFDIRSFCITVFHDKHAHAWTHTHTHTHTHTLCLNSDVKLVFSTVCALSPFFILEISALQVFHDDYYYAL